MREYQLYVKHHGRGPWVYVDTYCKASLAMQAQNLARSRECVTKLMAAPVGTVTKQDVQVTG